MPSGGVVPAFYEVEDGGACFCSGVMLLCLSNRVWCGEPLVVSGSEVVVVVEASFEL